MDGLLNERSVAFEYFNQNLRWRIISSLVEYNKCPILKLCVNLFSHF